MTTSCGSRSRLGYGSDMGRAGLVVCVAAEAALLVLGNRPEALITLLLFLVSLAGFALLLLGQREREAVTARTLALVVGGLLALAVAMPPRQSLDSHSYAMYGRMVATYHTSPYTHRPNDFPDDVWTKRVSKPWRKVPSVYGPAFTAVSAAGMAVAGTSLLAGRLFFQLLAALAVALALWLLYRRTHDVAAVACLGLNPVVVVSVVNGAHNDALVGLAVLGAALLALDGRWRWAGFVLALGVMVKVVAILSLGGLAVWAWRRRGLAAAAAAGITGGATCLVGYALAGGRAALAPLRLARLDVSGASIWNVPRRSLTLELVEDTGMRGKVAGAIVRGRISELSMLAVAALLLVIIIPRLRAPTPAFAMGGAMVAYLLGGAYVLPWYAFIALPALALHWRSRLNLLVTTLAALLGAAYGPRWALSADELHRLMADYSTRVIPAVEVAAIAALLVAAALQLRRTSRVSFDVLPGDVLAGVGLAGQAEDPVAKDVAHHL